MRLWPALFLLALNACTCGNVQLVGTRSSVTPAPAELDFGSVVIGEERSSSVTLAVSGVGTVALLSARFEGAPEFSSSFAPMLVQGGSERLVPFTFVPSGEGSFEATWLLETDAELSTEVRVTLRGRGVLPTCVDVDGDRFGLYCEPGGDCDDTNAAVNPGAAEACGNGLDDDCNPGTSDVCPCIDLDLDAHGENCDPGPDCDDTNAAVHPGAPELCGNGLDDDCNPGTSDVCPCIDLDLDTYGENCGPGPDCNDANAAVHPGAPELCGNGLDDDCDAGTSDVCPPVCIDGDGDGYGVNCAPGPDCNDANGAVHPGAPELCGNGLDDDCNPGTSDVCPCIDLDLDMHGENCGPGPDCNDANGAVHPGAFEACGNGLDDDCDPGTSDVCPPVCIDGDGDGYGQNCFLGLDCDDFKSFINPGQPERCGNVYDDDCNAATPDECPVACPRGGCGVGCADGEREAFVDQALYPAIAGCSGGFTVPGVFREQAPVCGRVSGDDSVNPSGWGCDASDLCAPGWHICRHVGEVAAKSVDGCAEPDARPGLFFATRQSGPGCGECATGIDPLIQCGGTDCSTSCYPNDFTSNDLFGCGGAGTHIWGSSCGVLSKFSNNGCISLPAYWSCDGNSGSDESLVVTKPGPDGGGVLCCAD